MLQRAIDQDQREQRRRRRPESPVSLTHQPPKPPLRQLGTISGSASSSSPRWGDADLGSSDEEDGLYAPAFQKSSGAHDEPPCYRSLSNLQECETSDIFSKLSLRKLSNSFDSSISTSSTTSSKAPEDSSSGASSHSSAPGDSPMLNALACPDEDTEPFSEGGLDGAAPARPAPTPSASPAMPAGGRTDDRSSQAAADAARPGPSSAPWAKDYSASTDALDDELADFTHFVDAHMAIHRPVIDGLIGRIQSCVQVLWKEAIVHPYGSLTTGLWLPNSDVDLVVTGIAVPMLHQLGNLLKQQSWVDASHVQIISSASMSLVKLVCGESPQASYCVDISFDVGPVAHTGLQMSDYLKGQFSEAPELRVLVLVLKQLLRERDLNELYTGGVSSFGIVLMATCVFKLYPSGYFEDTTASGYLQTQLLGTSFWMFDVSKFNAARNKARKLKVANASIKPSELLLSFFKLFSSSFDFSTIGVSADDTRLVFQRVDFGTVTQDRFQVFIEDPTAPGHNVSRSTREIEVISQVFEDALFALTFFRKTRMFPTPLSTILRNLCNNQNK